MFDSHCHKVKWKGRGFKQCCVQTGENAEGSGPPSLPGSPKNSLFLLFRAAQAAPGPAHPKHLWQTGPACGTPPTAMPCLAEPHTSVGWHCQGTLIPLSTQGWELPSSFPRGFFPSCFTGLHFGEEDALGNASCITFPDGINPGQALCLGSVSPQKPQTPS